MMLLLPAALFLAGFLVYAVRDRLARQRRLRRRLTGGLFQCRALFAVADEPLQRGRLDMAAGDAAAVRWQAWRNRAVVTLDDARVLSATVEPGGRAVRADDVLLRMRSLPGSPRGWSCTKATRRCSSAGCPTGRLPAAPAAVVLARLAPCTVRHLPPDGWEDRRRPGGSAARPTAWQAGRRLAPPIVMLAVLAVITAPWPYRWLVLHTHATAVVTGTSTGELQFDGPGPVPSDVTVRFPTPAGDDTRADVATNRDLPAGAPVDVRYAVDSSGWARLENPGDGLNRGAGLAAVGTVLLLAWLAWRLADLVAGNRAVRRALSGRRRPALALLTADPAGDPVLLVCGPVLVPVRLLAVPLRAPLPHGAAAAFPRNAALDVTALGRLAEDEPVVVELPGPAPQLLLVPAAWGDMP